MFPSRQAQKQACEEFYTFSFANSFIDKLGDKDLFHSYNEALDNLIWRIEIAIFNLNNARKTAEEVDGPKFFVPHSEVKSYISDLIKNGQIKIFKVKKYIKYD